MCKRSQQSVRSSSALVFPCLISSFKALQYSGYLASSSPMLMLDVLMEPSRCRAELCNERGCFIASQMGTIALSPDGGSSIIQPAR